MSKTPLVVDTGSSLVVVQGGEQPVTINDKKTLEELRVLLKQRKHVGLEISKKLKAHGIHIAGEEETVVSD